jgi:hypothetical protein
MDPFVLVIIGSMQFNFNTGVVTRTVRSIAWIHFARSRQSFSLEVTSTSCNPPGWCWNPVCLCRMLRAFVYDYFWIKLLSDWRSSEAPRSPRRSHGKPITHLATCIALLGLKSCKKTRSLLYNDAASVKIIWRLWYDDCWLLRSWWNQNWQEK